MKGLFDNCVCLAEAGSASKIKVKNYADTYLYGKGDYEKNLFNYMMTCEYVDKTNPSFEDLRFDVRKRQVMSSLIKVLDSKQVNLCIGTTALPKAFKVMVAKDIRGDKSLKVFIDVTGLIKKEDGHYSYRVGDIDILIAYLLSAMNAKIYFSDINKITNRANLVREAATCFSQMVYYILDYLRICSGPNARGRILYFSSIYFQTCILGKEANNETCLDRARIISGLDEREANMVEMFTDKIQNPYKDITTFVEGLKAITGTPSLTVDVFIDKWMWLFGVGTHFGTELYPAFADILIDAYVGGYMNNQKTIEKITGQNMVNFMNEIFKVGSELIR